MRKWMVFMSLSSCLFVSGIIPCRADDIREITIFHTNDQHGYMQDDQSRRIGIARIAGWKDAFPGSLLVDSGDAFYGGSLANTNRGKDVLKLMNAAGYDLMVPGNHDFTYGWQRLKELSSAATFPVLTSNVYQGADTFLQDTVIKEVQGIKIGFFGLVSEETLMLEQPDKLFGLSFHRPLDDAKRCVELLNQQGANVIIALSHLGMDEKDQVDMAGDIAKALPDIDVIIDAHSHHVLQKGKWVNRTLIVQAGKHEHYLGKLTISVDHKGQVVDVKDHLIGYEEAKKVPENPSVKALLETSVADQSGIASQTVGYTTLPMKIEPNTFSSFGSLAAQGFRQISETDIAFYEDRRRFVLPPGRINHKSLEELFLKDQPMVKIRISGRMLKQFLENGIKFDHGHVKTAFQMSDMQLQYMIRNQKFTVIEIEISSGLIDLTSDRRNISILLTPSLLNKFDFKHCDDILIGNQRELFYEYLEQNPVLSQSEGVRLHEVKTRRFPSMISIIPIIVLSISSGFVFYHRKHNL